MQDNVFQNYKNNAWANKAGIQLPGPDQIELFLPYHDKNLNADGGVVHGGILATLLHDVGFLTASEAFPEAPATAIDILDCQINYIKAAKETDVVAKATLIRKTRFLAFVDAEVQNPQGEPVARAHLVYRVVAENENRSDLNGDIAIKPMLSAEMETTPFMEMMNLNVQKRHSSLKVAGMGNGRCRFDLATEKDCLDEHGRIARGAQLLVLDNAAVFAGFSLMTSMKRAATVDLKLCFCDQVGAENLQAYGISVKQQENIIHNQVYLLTEQNQRMVAYGTMTFWS